MSDVKDIPLYKLSKKVLYKKAAERGAGDILKDIGGAIKRDHKFWTTPLGAVAGLALTRSLIPEEERTLTNQAAGTLAGAGVGYAGGSLLNSNRQPSRAEVDKMLMELEGDPNPELLEAMSKYYDPSIKGVTKDQAMDPTSVLGQKFHHKQPMRNQLVAYSVKAQLLKQRGDMEGYKEALGHVKNIQKTMNRPSPQPVVKALVNRFQGLFD
jgi:hypothetical protein